MNKVMEAVGKAGTAVGEVRGRLGAAAEKLLTNRRARRAPLVALSLGSLSYGPSEQAEAQGQTGEAGHFLRRQAELSRVMANPEATKAKVADSLLEVRLISPTLADRLEQQAMRRLMNVQRRMPKIPPSMAPFVDLGIPWVPSSRMLREFRDYALTAENPEHALAAAEAGSLSPTMAEALQENWPRLYQELAGKVMEDPDRLKSLSRESRQVLADVLGIQLHPTDSPEYMMRVQAMYMEKAGEDGALQQAQAGGSSIRAGLISPAQVPGTAPTPGQQYSMPLRR
jgi:hypothetical protein